MVGKDVLLDVVEKFVLLYINLMLVVKEDFEGNKLLVFSNFGMGYVFEELICKFNEENNEEVGEYFILCEVIELMMYFVFDLIKDNLLFFIIVYDLVCGSGGMLIEM